MFQGNSSPWRALQIILLVCVLGNSHQLRAQQTGQGMPATSPQNPVLFPPAPPATPQTPTKAAMDSGTTTNKSDPDPNVPQNDRILWTLPNYLTVENASSMPPLTREKKFKLTAEDDLDPVEFGFVGLAAGVNQATNAYPNFGQGLKGYGKRYALELADNTIENFMTQAIFPAALHQDPRYYQLAKGGFIHRFAYSASRIVVTRSDSGNAQFNFSEIFGAAMSEAVSDSYHPGPRTLGATMDVWVTQIAWDAAGFEMKEFWPDLHHYLTHRKH